FRFARHHERQAKKILPTLISPDMWFWVSRARFNSFTASLNRCLQPRYFSVVCTETWPSRNCICSSSPPALWQRRAHDLRRSCGASFRIPTLPAYCLTTCHTTFSVISVPQIVPILHTQRNNRPLTIFDAASQSSTVPLTHEGTGIVRM